MWKINISFLFFSVIVSFGLFSERFRYGEARRQDKIEQWSGETFIFIKYVTTAFVTSWVFNSKHIS